MCCETGCNNFVVGVSVSVSTADLCLVKAPLVFSLSLLIVCWISCKVQTLATQTCSGRPLSAALDCVWIGSWDYWLGTISFWLAGDCSMCFARPGQRIFSTLPFSGEVCLVLTFPWFKSTFISTCLLVVPLGSSLLLSHYGARYPHFAARLLQ